MNTNTEKEFEIDLGRLLRTLWRYAPVILIIGILFAGLFFTYARLFIKPTYQANALFYVNNSTISLSSAVKISSGDLDAASGLVKTYLAILQSRANMEQVIEESGVRYSYEKLRSMVSATSVNSTGLFRVTVTSSNPEEARALANVIAAILPSKISDIVIGSNVVVVDYAVTPHTRTSPNYVKMTLLGLAVGVLFSGAIVVILDLMDDVIHDEDYLLQKFNAPMLASIPDLTARTSKKYGYGYGYAAASRSAKKGGVD